MSLYFIYEWGQNSEIHSHSTRQSDNYYPPNFKYDVTRTSVRYLGCTVWNEQDSKTKLLTVPISKFKKHILKKWFPD